METVRACEWNNWLSTTVHGQGFGALFRPERFNPDVSTHASIKEKARACITESFDMIEARLDGVHAVGGAYTAVDVYLFVFYRWANEGGWSMREDYPKFTALVEELVKNPAVGKALEAEDIQSTL